MLHCLPDAAFKIQRSTFENTDMYLPQLLARAEKGEKLCVLTCYDASFARLLAPMASMSCWWAIRSA
jgi:hypothetical protein